ncbi:hypothetical protein BH09SUM1_BH09SUM1_21080 [soil metagenome]
MRTSGTGYIYFLEWIAIRPPLILRLSKHATEILNAIAEGKSYDEILSAGIAGCYPDIFLAAADALELAETDGGGGEGYPNRMAESKAAHPRAYAP